MTKNKRTNLPIVGKHFPFVQKVPVRLVSFVGISRVPVRLVSSTGISRVSLTCRTKQSPVPWVSKVSLVLPVVQIVVASQMEWVKI